MYTKYCVSEGEDVTVISDYLPLLKDKDNLRHYNHAKAQYEILKWNATTYTVYYYGDTKEGEHSSLQKSLFLNFDSRVKY